jgi:hypothetical protein
MFAKILQKAEKAKENLEKQNVVTVCDLSRCRKYNFVELK